MQSLIQRLSNSGYSKYLAIKKQAKRLQRAAPSTLGQEFPLHKCQETVARIHGYSNWHELTTHAQRAGLDDDPFWRIRSRSDSHENMLEALLKAEIEIGNHAIIFDGLPESTSGIALTLFLEEISARKSPGLILVDTGHHSFQETPAWEAVKRIGLEDVVHKFEHVDLRDRNIDFCFQSRASEWLLALDSIMPMNVSQKFEESGARVLFEKIIDTLGLTTAPVYGSGEYVRPDRLFAAWENLKALPNSAERLHDILENNNDDPSELDWLIAKYSERSMKGVAYALPSIESAIKELRGYRFGNYLLGGGHKPQRPTIALFDHQDVASTLLASMIAQTFSPGCDGRNPMPMLLLSTEEGNQLKHQTTVRRLPRGNNQILAIGGSVRDEEIWKGSWVLTKKFVDVCRRKGGDQHHEMTTSGKMVFFNEQ